MQGKYQKHGRHKVNGYHRFEYELDFRPYFLGNCIVAVTNGRTTASVIFLVLRGQ